MKVIGTKVDDSIYAAIVNEAGKLKKTKSEYLRRIIGDALVNHTKKANNEALDEKDKR